MTDLCWQFCIVDHSFLEIFTFPNHPNPNCLFSDRSLIQSVFLYLSMLNNHSIRLKKKCENWISIFFFHFWWSKTVLSLYFHWDLVVSLTVIRSLRPLSLSLSHTHTRTRTRTYQTHACNVYLSFCNDCLRLFLWMAIHESNSLLQVIHDFLLKLSLQ